ncbi:S9 family peptidase [Myroides odoratimimus]|uniref:alpha/beta hydrolase family protein n=1 Tax=Myroides odoratimimus TaxID=76832 RepID=UPI00257809F4|nr:prolyl oligopeptidase family serine peptidase [Myroides odoratimimus]MDM1468105.1 S9 family peptidase [Myroides odoratimimus]MDM1471410.1 S9 family peptidase [Myroides odoratimimus]MDM1481484.1 S9 family peptidase [Myroides odoratimimus]
MDIKTIIILCISLFYIKGYTQNYNPEVTLDPNWHFLKNNALSKDGQWSIITLHYSQSASQTYLINTNSKQKTNLGSVGKLEFISDSHIVYQDMQSKTVVIFNLKTKDKSFIENAQLIDTINPHHVILFKSFNTNKHYLIQITNNSFNTISDSEGIALHQYSTSPDQNNLIYQTNTNEVFQIDFRTNHTSLISSKMTPISLFNWSSDSKLTTFLPEQYNNNFLYYYNRDDKKVKVIELPTNNLKILTVSKVFYLNDSIYIFYALQNRYKNELFNKIEQWNTNDKKLGSKSKPTPEYDFSFELLAYNSSNQSQNSIDLPKDFRIIDINNPASFVLYNNQTGNNYTSSQRPTDFQLYNSLSQKKDTITTELFFYSSLFSYASDGKHISHKTNKDNTWSIYNTEQDLLKKGEFKHDSDNPISWSKDNKHLYHIYKSNLYKYDIEKQIDIKLTNFNNQNIKIKLINLENYKKISSEYIEPERISHITKVLFSVKDTNTNLTSLYILDHDEVKIIIESNADYLSEFKWDPKLESISYIQENYDTPPSVMLWKKNEVDTLYKNTIPEKLYYYRKKKIIKYKVAGQELQGILLYPKNYNKTKIFPMVTYIYQIQRKKTNQFDIPTYKNDIGFNASLLVENDYFVFYPDIIYTSKGPGVSALKCVKKAIKQALKEENSIDKKNIGLFGHSHGGYETNYIITQTNIFKAAISTSGNSDIIRSYFSYNYNFNTPFYFQYETGQYEMKTDFASNKKLYLKNSPIIYVDKIKTPLFQWAGKLDQNIDWNQSKEFFIALQRYKIPNITLFYENEGHAIISEDMQFDITTRTMQWYDYYLKGNKNIQWIKTGTTFK